MTISIKHWPETLFIGCSIVLSAGAQLLMKAGMLELVGVDMARVLESVPMATAHLLPTAVWVLIGLGCYAISMLTWLAALTKYELSLAYPLLSISYVLVYIGAILWPRLHESVSVSKTIGILFILVGVFLVTRTQSNGRESRESRES